MTAKFPCIYLTLCVLFLSSSPSAAQVDALVTEEFGPETMLIANQESATSLYVDEADHAVVRHAVRLLGEDVERVTGQKPSVQSDAQQLPQQVIIVGTIGKSELIDDLIEQGKLDVEGVRGEWESFVIQSLKQPIPGVEQALVLAGGDRRGTAYAVFELSEQMGISPWYWWADVTPLSKSALYAMPGTFKQGPPSVKYRGIFINDEDWGLEPWNRLTFDPPNEDLGPKAYEKVFELILRLRGNHLWPAMHHVTNEFAAVPGNVELADEWAIVMGSAHSEPMLRNNVWWRRDGEGDWRFDTNRSGVIAYWEEWAKMRGQYENVWTVGMRGIHDTEMEGPQTVNQQAALLGQVIRAQRALLKQYANENVENVPQVFTPYKEALAQYQAGLELPEDITIVWAEDNYGYIRQLSTPEEQKRSGGSGVYYHISYLGWPRPYLWINTTPPALIWSEMHKAYAYNADRVWVLNVGDIKPGEIGMEFWLRMAWDARRYGPDAQLTFLREWAGRDFGPEFADEIAQLMNDFYHLTFGRKPELMASDLFSVVHYDEATRRLEAHHSLMRRAESIHEQIPEQRRAAFYQLVLYPVRVAALTNEAFITADLSQLYQEQGRSTAQAFAQRSRQAVARIEAETDYYNNELSGGKWRHTKFTKGISGNWNVRWPHPQVPAPSNQSELGVVLENRAVPLVDVQGSPEPVVIDLHAADASFEAPMQLLRDEHHQYLAVPNTEQETAGNTLEAGTGAQAVFDFEVPEAGSYHLFLLVNVPTNKDDSWFVKMNDQEWRSWNDIPARKPWDWQQQGTYELEKGTHTLTIANREDGAMFSRIRLTPRATALSLSETYPDSGPADRLPTFDARLGERRFVELFTTGTQPLQWTASTNEPWIKLDRAHGQLDGQDRLWVDIDWDNAPNAEQVEGSFTITAGDVSHTVGVDLFNPEHAATVEVGSFVEANGYVAIEAEHFTRQVAGDDASWEVVSDLGRLGDAITVLPETMPSRQEIADIQASAPAVEYDVTFSSQGSAEIILHTLPTHRIHEGRRLRYAIALDDQEPQIVDFYESGGHGGEQSAQWRDNVSRNASITRTTHRLDRSGLHVVRIWAVDPGVVIDRLVIDTGGLKPSYFGPPETRVTPEHPPATQGSNP